MNIETTAQLLTISSVAQEATENTIAVVARWKQMGDTILSPNNRVRSVLLPAGIWMDTIKEFSSTASQNFQLFVHDAIADLAKEFLSTICTDSKMLRTEVPLQSFSLSALLQWNADRAAASGRLNGDEIKKWIASSVTIKTVTATHGAKIGEALGAQFVRLASPNHGLTSERATKLLTNLWNAVDADSTTGLRVQLRLQAIADRTETTEANILDSIM